MAGRVKRKALAALPDPSPTAEAERCALCGRPLGTRIEWHHGVPKRERGCDTVPLHPICHRPIHNLASNAGLARLADPDALRGRDGMRRFRAWIADKPADFHAPTRGAR